MITLLHGFELRLDLFGWVLAESQTLLTEEPCAAIGPPGTCAAGSLPGIGRDDQITAERQLGFAASLHGQTLQICTKSAA